MNNPKFKVGQVVWFVYDHYVNKLEIARIVDEGEGWRYEPLEAKFPNSETTFNPFATREEAEEYRLQEIDKAVDEYKRKLIARKREKV